MKLSLACALATLISVVAFVAIFAMSVLVYDNVATINSEPDGQDWISSKSVAEQLDQELQPQPRETPQTKSQLSIFAPGFQGSALSASNDVENETPTANHATRPRIPVFRKPELDEPPSRQIADSPVSRNAQLFRATRTQRPATGRASKFQSAMAPPIEGPDDSTVFQNAGAIIGAKTENASLEQPWDTTDLFSNLQPAPSVSTNDISADPSLKSAIPHTESQTVVDKPVIASSDVWVSPQLKPSSTPSTIINPETNRSQASFSHSSDNSIADGVSGIVAPKEDMILDLKDESPFRPTQSQSKDRNISFNVSASQQPTVDPNLSWNPVPTSDPAPRLESIDAAEEPEANLFAKFEPWASSVSQSNPLVEQPAPKTHDEKDINFSADAKPSFDQPSNEGAPVEDTTVEGQKSNVEIDQLASADNQSLSLSTIDSAAPVESLTEILSEDSLLENTDDSNIAIQEDVIIEPSLSMKPAEVAHVEKQQAPAPLEPQPETLPQPQSEQVAQNSEQSQTIGTENVVAIDDQPSTIDETEREERPAEIATNTTNVKSAKEPVKQRTVIRKQTWPRPGALLGELDELADEELARDWTNATRHAFEMLESLELADQKSGAWLDHCHQLAMQLSQLSQEMSQAGPSYHQSATKCSRIAYQMKRKIDIWKSVHKAAARNLAEKPAVVGRVVASLIGHRRSEIDFDGINAQWKEYLMLDSAEEIFNAKKPNERRYRSIAHKILARATSDALDKEQMAYAQNLIGNDLAETLRGVAAGQVQLAQFLVDLEKYDSKPTPGSSARLSDHFQSYYWNRDLAVRGVSDLYDDHYRNANLRIELSQAQLNALVPSEASTIQQPVVDKILEANVFGQSRVTNQIRVELVPDPDHLSIRLVSNGRVLSRTRSHARGFTFNNLGNGLVNASKIIALGRDGITASPTDINASSSDRLLGVNGQLDGVPVLGNLTRRIAQQQQQAQKFQVKQIVERKLENEYRQRVDSEVESAVQRARDWFLSKILTPLHSMELEPTVIQVQTTEQAAVVRYRLAGLDQNAADTPRPNSQPGSLASFQMHRSAINNILNRIHINGKSFTTSEFLKHLNDLVGTKNFGATENSKNKNVKFKFHTRDAIQFDFVDGKLEITLRIKNLQLNRHTRWNNLLVVARYSPVAQGQQIRLKFDEEFSLQIQGRGLSLADQIGVRTVFGTIFRPNFQFQLFPPEIANHRAARNLAISQLVLDDGWLGVSLSDVNELIAGNYQQLLDEATPADASKIRQSQTIDLHEYLHRQDSPASRQQSHPGNNRAASILDQPFAVGNKRFDRGAGARQGQQSKFYRPRSWR